MAPSAAALRAGGPLPSWHPDAVRALLDRGRPAAAAAALRGLGAWLGRRRQTVQLVTHKCLGSCLHCQVMG